MSIHVELMCMFDFLFFIFRMERLAFEMQKVGRRRRFRCTVFRYNNFKVYIQHNAIEYQQQRGGVEITRGYDEPLMMKYSRGPLSVH